jgi:hypothetical protein
MYVATTPAKHHLPMNGSVYPSSGVVEPRELFSQIVIYGLNYICRI